VTENRLTITIIWQAATNLQTITTTDNLL